MDVVADGLLGLSIIACLGLHRIGAKGGNKDWQVPINRHMLVCIRNSYLCMHECGAKLSITFLFLVAGKGMRKMNLCEVLCTIRVS